MRAVSIKVQLKSIWACQANLSAGLVQVWGKVSAMLASVLHLIKIVSDRVAIAGEIKPVIQSVPGMGHRG